MLFSPDRPNFPQVRAGASDKRDMQALQAALEVLQNAELKLEKTAKRLADAASPDAPVDSVSLSDEVVAMLEARNQAAVAVSVAHTDQEMQQRVLDILG